MRRPWSGSTPEAGAAIIASARPASRQGSPGVPTPPTGSTHGEDCQCPACDTHRAFHALLRAKDEFKPRAAGGVKGVNRGKINRAPASAGRAMRPEWDSGIDNPLSQDHKAPAGLLERQSPRRGRAAGHGISAQNTDLRPEWNNDCTMPLGLYRDAMQVGEVEESPAAIPRHNMAKENLGQLRPEWDSCTDPVDSHPEASTATGKEDCSEDVQRHAEILDVTRLASPSKAATSRPQTGVSEASLAGPPAEAIWLNDGERTLLPFDDEVALSGIEAEWEKPLDGHSIFVAIEDGISHLASHWDPAAPVAGKAHQVPTVRSKAPSPVESIADETEESVRASNELAASACAQSSTRRQPPAPPPSNRISPRQALQGNIGENSVAPHARKRSKTPTASPAATSPQGAPTPPATSRREESQAAGRTPSPPAAFIRRASSVRRRETRPEPASRGSAGPSRPRAVAARGTSPNPGTRVHRIEV